MSDEILYNFGQNHGSLNDITGMTQQIQSVRQDLESIFSKLQHAYGGDGSDAMYQAHQKMNSMLDEALNTTVNTQNQGIQQQEAMAALDRAHAANFGG